ncbi:phosphopantetheine-binding protein [Streptomyces violaceoruber]|uniref:phosphopantetheine-binding protein n=1 Tax=Streptomyces violaceoruber TaxID=1935 RepID=UPI003B21708C
MRRRRIPLRSGDSLTVTRLISLVHPGTDLTFQDVFDHPTPQELAQLVEVSGPFRGEGRPGTPAPVRGVRPVDERTSHRAGGGGALCAAATALPAAAPYRRGDRAAPAAHGQGRPGGAPGSLHRRHHEGASAGSASGPSLTARLVELCGRALGAPCGAGESLFARGGDSLTVTRLISLVHRELETDLTFQDVFDHPTPQELAQLVEVSGPFRGEPQ